MYIPKPKFKVCLLGDQAHCDEAGKLGVPFMFQEDLKKLNIQQGQEEGKFKIINFYIDLVKISLLYLNVAFWG